MIAFALREPGRDPSWIVGGEVPQLGANAGAGEGWLVVEGDESDRSVEALRPRIAVVTNVDLDHHATFGSRGRGRGAVRALARATCRRSCAAGSSSRVDVRARGAGRAQPAERGRGARGARARGCRSGRCGRRRSRGSRASGGGSSSSARPAGSRSTTTTRTTRRRSRAAIAAAREQARRPRARPLPAAPLLADAAPRRASSARALAAADVVARHRRLPGARGAGRRRDRQARRRRARDARPGFAPGWTPRLEDGARFVARRARPGTCVTVGAGDVDRAAPLILEELGVTLS